MKTALVTGGAGVMGTRLVRRLVLAGWQVRVLVLPGDHLRSRVEQLGAEIREGDVADAASLVGLCDGVDTVYHLAALIIAADPQVFRRVNRDGTTHLVTEATRAGVRHFVYVSSASVVYPRRTPYAESKLEAEQIVTAETRLAHTIVRPTLVYDTGGAQEIMMFLDYLRRFPIVPFIGAGGAIKRPVWAEDVVDGLVRLAENDVALGKTYDFCGPDRITMLELAQLLLQHHDRPRPFLHLPVWLCRALALVASYLFSKPPLTSSAIAGIVSDADLDPTVAMRELGYQPMGVREGFARCFPIAAREPATPSLLPRALRKGTST